MCDSPFIKDKRRKRRIFPFDGDRRSQVFVNDPKCPENNRRMRVDPLIDGHDPGEDPLRKPKFRRGGTKIPIR